jgi:hypothetical protein
MRVLVHEANPVTCERLVVITPRKITLEAGNEPATSAAIKRDIAAKMR